MNASTAPSPTSGRVPFDNPCPRASTPTSNRPPPTSPRRRSERSSAGPESRIASTGETRAARRAGMSAAAAVTPTPTAIAATTVRPAMTVGPLGSGIPSTSSNARSPAATAMPRANPAAELTTPTTSASSRTERVTCPRLAPRARIRASSLVRWATSIENVLKIRKAPTNSEMPAKTSRAVEKNPRPCLICALDSLTAWAVVTASKPPGSSRAIRDRSSAWLTPSAAAIASWV